MTFKCYVAGVSASGIDYIKEALSVAFEGLGYEIEELNNSTLRSKVRQSMGSNTIVLVVLDTMSKAACDGIDKGLFNSDKFIEYLDDVDLVNKLNERYSLSINPPVEETTLTYDEDVYSRIETLERNSTADNEKYDAQLREKDEIISSLEQRLKELSGYGYTPDNQLDAENQELREENLNLHNKINDLNKTIKDYETIKVLSVDKERQIDSAKRDIAKYKSKVTDLEEDVRNLNLVISAKEKEINQLTTKLDTEVKKLNDKILDAQDSAKGKDSKIESQKEDITRLTNTISSLNHKIERLEKDIENSRINQEEEINKKLSESNKEVEELNNSISSLNIELDNLTETYNNLLDDYEKQKGELASITKQKEEYEKNNTLLNQEVIDLNKSLEDLKTSANVNYDVADLLEEKRRIEDSLTRLKSDIFSVIGSQATLANSIKVSVLQDIHQRYKNINFVFAGSSESKKGTYKAIRNICSSNLNSKFVIVDITSETDIDYVFQMDKNDIKDARQWFVNGGGFKQYLSKTSLMNTEVLMLIPGYINDTAFLRLNWSMRLAELEQSGYAVIVMCGDVSNLVGRVLFESFSVVGNTQVYVHGTAAGARTIIANSRGLNNIGKANIFYFNCLDNIDRFYNIMSKKAKCSKLPKMI